jgi:hypothetical protein
MRKPWRQTVVSLNLSLSRAAVRSRQAGRSGAVSVSVSRKSFGEFEGQISEIALACQSLCDVLDTAA